MPTIEFRMDTTGIPHTYVVISNGNGTAQMYGFAPAVAGNLWGKGHIYDESVSGDNGDEHPWDHTTGPIEVTSDQYNRVVNEVNHAISNPPDYNLPASILRPNAVNQCATWANHLADVGGFSDKLPWGGNGWNPYGQSTWTELEKFWKRNPSATSPILDPLTNTHFLAAKNWVPPRDPLVLDRDGNGQIDTGRELFGDATVLAHGPRAGRQAQDGYEALADQDSNADQVLDSTDVAWGQLRVWRDLNQDGISQAGELQSRNAQWPRVSGCGRKYKRNWALALDRIGFSATEFN